MIQQLVESIEKLAGAAVGQNMEQGLKIGLAVEHFGIEMAARMLKKMREGYVGWNDPTAKDDVALRLLQKAAKAQAGTATEKDLIDIANFAMILWTRGDYEPLDE